jgi:hypothetical protein
MAWTTAQIRDFAKDIYTIDFKDGAVVGYLTGPMRSALVSAAVLSIVRQQSRLMVEVSDIDDLLKGVLEYICTKHGKDFFE